jgi:hypothetical protein
MYAGYDHVNPCKIGRSCTIERSVNFFGWVLLVKPWRLKVSDDDHNENDRSNFGAATISREVADQGAVEQVSVNRYIADLFDGPEDLYRLFQDRRELWGAGVYENPARPYANEPFVFWETSLFHRELVGTQGKLLGKYSSVGTEYAVVTRYLDLSNSLLRPESTDPANFPGYARVYPSEFTAFESGWRPNSTWVFNMPTVVFHPLPHRLFWQKDGGWIEIDGPDFGLNPLIPEP